MRVSKKIFEATAAAVRKAKARSAHEGHLHERALVGLLCDIFVGAHDSFDVERFRTACLGEEASSVTD